MDRRRTTNNKLDTWRQNRCIICQRFLSKRQFKYCVKCAKEMQEQKETEWRELHSEKIKEIDRKRSKKFYLKHRKEILVKTREYFQTQRGKEVRRRANKRYYQKGKVI